MTRRTEKVGDTLQAAIADLLERRVKDAALDGVMLSITHVRVAPDLTTARVHVSLLGVEEERVPTVLAALERAEPFMHRELLHQLRMRRVPRLRFIRDRSIEEGDRMTTLMREIARAEGREL
ncbi:MAG: 30S ribosome-binding factor RbfA [Chloroflexi bacterium]|nr:30S ribosome-binding factor RbfA [Chloroflexota bacterium]